MFCVDTSTQTNERYKCVDVPPQLASIIVEPHRISLPLLVVSVCLLFLGSLDDGIAGQLALICWLMTVLPLALLEPGGAFGMYVASVALFSGSMRNLVGHSSVIERPDEYAFLLLVAGLTIVGLQRSHATCISRFTIIVAAFLAYGLPHLLLVGFPSRTAFAGFSRCYGTVCISALLWWAAPTIKELRSFALITTILGVHMSGVSLLEALHWHSLIFPKWIADPALNSNIAETIGSGRSGGLLMQAEFNGAALGLIACIIWAWIRLGDTSVKAPKYAALILCAAGMYFTYTRAAWLGAVGAFLILLLYKLRSEQDQRKATAWVITTVCVAASLAIIPDHRASERLGDSANGYFRLNLWTGGLKMAAERPLFGYGVGQFSTNITSYHDESGLIPFTPIDDEGTVAHNTLINILTEEGLVGLILYLAIIVVLYQRTRRSATLTWGNAGAAWVSATCLLFVINMQFVVAYEPTNNLLLFGTLGMIAGLRRNNIPVLT